MRPAVLIREAGDGVGHALFALEGETTIGGADAAIDVGVVKRRAVVAWRDHAWRVRSLHEEVLLDGELLRTEAELRPGATLSGRGWRLRFVPGDRASARAQHLHVTSAIDGLTELVTRRVAYRRLETMTTGVVILIDLDRFKHLNDIYGLPTGDAVLRRTARILRAHLAWPDLVARYGGEEFLVLLPSHTLATARVIAEAIRAAAEVPFEHEGSQLIATVSLGLATHGGQVSPTLHRAEAALASAKTQGRNRVIG